MLGGVSDRSSARPVSLVERVATTAIVPVLVLLADRVPLAFVDGGMLARAKVRLSPFSVGLGPFITAYALVELAALLVPRLRRARHEARGRVWLERTSAVLALGIALVQSYGVALYLESSDIALVAGWEARVVNTATLTGGMCLMALAARWATRRGLVNGYVLWWTLPVVFDLLRGDAFRQAAVRGGAHDVVLLAIALAVVVVATCVAVAGGGSAATAARIDGSAYRGDKAAAPRAGLPVPVSSVQPITAASSVLIVPSLLATLHVPGMRALQGVLQRGDALFEVAYMAVLVLATLVAAVLLHRPSEMAAFVRRLGTIDDETARADARASLRRALLPTLVYLLVLVVAMMAAGRLSSAQPPTVMLALAIAGVLDLVRSCGAHFRARDLVCVAEERDAYGVAALRAALAAQGIDARPRGMAALSMLQAFGPYAPVELYVRETDAARASALLRHWAAGDAKPAAPPQTAHPSLPGGWVPWSPATRTAILVAVGGVGLGVALVPRPSLMPPGAPARRAEIALVRVDDQIDPLHAADEDTPEGANLYTELAPLGPQRRETRHYARVVPRRGESNDAAWSRVLPWLQRFPLPPGERWAWQPVMEPDDAGEEKPVSLHVVGLRTFVLAGDAAVTTADVKSAEVGIDEQQDLGQAYVLVTLTDEGAERFYRLTREWIERRLAIVVDGHIDSAPIIKSPISGGRVTITMGAGDPDKQLAEARALAASLQ
jgi:hypothetical protein